MSQRSLPAELADVVRRVAHYPHGLGFLHHGWVDCVAVTLGVHPYVIDATRAYLETDEGRAELIEAVRRESERRLARPLSHTPSRRTLRGCEERSRALIEAAEKDPRGVAFLAGGELAEVARAFRVHPYLVCRARGLLERRGVREPGEAAVVRE
jgi:hypothetical protein